MTNGSITNGIASIELPRVIGLGIFPDWDWRFHVFNLVVVAAAGLLLWLAVNRVEWLRHSRQKYQQTEQALFGELCQTHELSRTDRNLLALICESSGGNSICRIFVDPQVIQQFAQSHPAENENCQHLARRLFGTHAR